MGEELAHVNDMDPAGGCCDGGGSGDGSGDGRWTAAANFRGDVLRVRSLFLKTFSRLALLEIPLRQEMIRSAGGWDEVDAVRPCPLVLARVVTLAFRLSNPVLTRLEKVEAGSHESLGRRL